MIPWHRLFAIGLTDLLAGTAWEVVMELDLSVKQQMLDIVVVRRGEGAQPVELPDGLGPLADHNLVTYKSLREPLDGWALKELVGHSVNYRKQVSPSLDQLLPEDAFRLFAVATRFPEKLATQVEWQPIQPGVYDVPWGTDLIRLLVLNEVPTEDHNAFWNLFSADRAGRLRFGSIPRPAQRREFALEVAVPELQRGGSHHALHPTRVLARSHEGASGLVDP